MFMEVHIKHTKMIKLAIVIFFDQIAPEIAPQSIKYLNYHFFIFNIQCSALILYFLRITYNRSHGIVWILTVLYDTKQELTIKISQLNTTWKKNREWPIINDNLIMVKANIYTYLFSIFIFVHFVSLFFVICCLSLIMLTDIFVNFT